MARDDQAVPVDEQHGRELDGCALLTRQLLDRDDLPGRPAVLLAPGRDHGFHSADLSLRATSTRIHQTTRRRLASTGQRPPARPQAVFMYSASFFLTKRRERCTRDFTAGRLMPSASAMSGLERPSTSWSTSAVR